MTKRQENNFVLNKLYGELELMKRSAYLSMTLEGQRFYDEVGGRLDYDLSQKLEFYGNYWDNYERAHLKIKISELRAESDQKLIYESFKEKFAKMGLDF